jgi:hypothetical protein
MKKYKITLDMLKQLDIKSKFQNALLEKLYDMGAPVRAFATFEFADSVKRVDVVFDKITQSYEYTIYEGDDIIQNVETIYQKEIKNG